MRSSRYSAKVGVYVRHCKVEFKKHVFPTLTKPGPILLFDFQVVDSVLLSKRTRVSFIVELLSRVAEFLAIAGLGELWFGF